VKDQLQDAWHIHNNMNLLLIDNISDEGMQKTLSTKGGRTIYLQLVHMHNARMDWLEVCAKDVFKKYEKLAKDPPYSRKNLKDALLNSATGISEFIDRSWEKQGKVTGFKKGLIPFVSYLISHESHHRGNILLTLKLSGVKLPDILKWGLWEWGK
jgi:uncharacterized damage-inducible protein DinB